MPALRYQRQVTEVNPSRNKLSSAVAATVCLIGSTLLLTSEHVQSKQTLAYQPVYAETEGAGRTFGLRAPGAIILRVVARVQVRRLSVNSAAQVSTLEGRQDAETLSVMRN
jgi:hypothetical protein